MVDLRKGEQMRAGVYGRQSHGKQTSVDDQIRMGRAVCERKPWAVAREYRDNVSASPFATQARDDWPVLVADVDAGRLDVVIMWEATRGDRTLTSWSRFLDSCKDAGVLIYSIKAERTYDVRIARDWTTLAEDGVRAQSFSLNLSEDIRRGVEGAALAGKPHGRPPHGYVRIYDSTDRRKFTQVADEHAAVNAEIIERVARHDPILAIKKDLHRRGVWTPGAVARARSRTGVLGPLCELGCDHGSCLSIRGKWYPNTVRQIATRASYAGIREHKGSKTEATWAGIVDVEVFHTAQMVLADPTRKTTQPGSYKWLLSYVATSTHGGGLNRRPGRNGRKPTYRCVEDGCVGVGMTELDEYVTELVLARLARPDARDVLAAATVESARISEELAAARAEHDELAALVDRKELSLVFAAKAEPGILARIAAAEQALSSTARNGAVLALLGEGQVTVGRLRPRWDRLTVAGRRAVVNEVVSAIVVHPTEERLTRWSSDAERLRIASARTEVIWRR